MQQTLSQLKTLQCEIVSNKKYTFYNTFAYSINAKIIFDTNASLRPVIKNVVYDMAENYDSNTIIKRKIYNGKCLTIINKTTREISINTEFKDKEEVLFNFEKEIAPLFFISSLNFFDSLFSKTYIAGSIDKEKIKFEVKSDTACLSGDC